MVQRGASGQFQILVGGGESVRAFVPAELPPEPPPEIVGPRARLHGQALLACGRLDAVTALLPEPELFHYAFVRREALGSSQIEGTKSYLSDLLLFELEEVPGVPLGGRSSLMFLRTARINQQLPDLVPHGRNYLGLASYQASSSLWLRFRPR